MTDVVIGAAVAAVAAGFYALAVVVQAVEIRAVPEDGPPGLSFLVAVVQRPRWLLGAALAGAGWLLQLGALLLAPLTVVAPVLALSVLMLLACGHVMLGEPIGRSDVVATVAIVAGVAAIAWAAPPRGLRTPDAMESLAAASVLAALSTLPWALRRAPVRLALASVAGAGFAFALGDLATKLLTDRLAAGSLPWAAVWLAVAGGAALLALGAETVALQRVPAVHVVAVAYAVQTVAATVSAEALGLERWAASRVGAGGLLALILAVAAAAAILARSTSVRAIVQPDGQPQ